MDPRHNPFDFNRDIEAAPDWLGKLVESHESLPWQRRGYLRKAMLDRLTTTAGWAPAPDATGAAGAEEGERDSDSVREFLDAQRSGWGAKFAAVFED